MRDRNSVEVRSIGRDPGTTGLQVGTEGIGRSVLVTTDATTYLCVRHALCVEIGDGASRARLHAHPNPRLGLAIFGPNPFAALRVVGHVDIGYAHPSSRAIAVGSLHIAVNVGHGAVRAADVVVARGHAVLANLEDLLAGIEDIAEFAHGDFV